MKLSINPLNEYRVVPDIGENRSLPKNKQFAVILKKRNRLYLQTGALNAKGRFDLAEYTRLCIEKIENPPMLDIGGTEKELTVDDIFSWPELESVADELFYAATQLHNKADEIKNLWRLSIL